jgi:hypothetical protein
VVRVLLQVLLLLLLLRLLLLEEVAARLGQRRHEVLAVCRGSEQRVRLRNVHRVSPTLLDASAAEISLARRRRSFSRPVVCPV